MRWVAWTAFSTLPEVILETILLLSVGESLQGHPNLIIFLAWVDLFDDPGHSRLPQTSLGGYLPSRKARFREKKNIGSSRGGNGFHDEVGLAGWYLCSLYHLELCK